VKTDSRTVRIFLSSTFRDFAEERDLLVRKVFPELRRKCRERQVELVDVDLRWGITEKEAQQGKVLPICLAEIDRSRPFFMGFIGERYGWIPEPEKYDVSLIMEQPWLDEHRGGKSVTELEMLHGVLNNPAMEDRAFFYFRDPKWSQKKGGAYLCEGSAEKEKLEALKNRIRKSGFPVVENYANPEALAEHVKQDLWKLIDDAFPESKVPGALDLERRRHEIYSASRQGMYIGGEKYFAALDEAMAEQPRKPVLVTGASGGGKSALVANWSQSFAAGHPNAVVLEHYLATGADSAEATGMVTRLLKEISRLTGEDLVLEGDPRKALHIFEQWLGKAGAFTQQQGGEFVVVLDGLDKMTGGGGLDWWPRRLPDGVGLVVSCLPGSVFDAIAQRMDWDQVVISPLGRDDCEAFTDRYLGKFRKPLPPELVELILQNSLCGNPLFLRTLLEEMRVFGVHEQLRQRLEHYLASRTIDDLFERVLERIEADNRPDDVRAVLEVLWAAKESFAENELLEISGLPPAVWAPIHIALDDSLIGEGGRLLFGHDYMRKAVEDRYLRSAEARAGIRKRMAEFCEQAMADGRKNISPYVRRHAVEHFVEAEDWDNATAALSDLEFIEARSVAQELPAMLADYAEAANLLPEGEKERETEAARQAELDRYAKEMVEYSAAWTRIREGAGKAEPPLPRTVESVPLWTEEEIAAERLRVTKTPNRRDIVKAFRVFVATNSYPLQVCSTQEGFVANLARNDAPAGPVNKSGEELLRQFTCTKILRQFVPGDIYNPLPACVAVLEGRANKLRYAALTYDGRRCISGGDKMLFGWDVQTGQCLHLFKGHTDSINCFALSPDGRRFVSGGADNSLRLWDVQTGQCLYALEGHVSGVNAVSLATDGRFAVSGSADQTLRVWDLDTGVCQNVLRGHNAEVHTVVLSRDGRLAVSGGEDGEICVWDIPNGRCLRTIKVHTEEVSALVVSADGRRALSGCDDGTLFVWDTKSGARLHFLVGHTGSIYSVVLSADGRRAVSTSGDNTLRIWDILNGKCLNVLSGHNWHIIAVSLAADARRAISASLDQTLRVWDMESGQCLRILEGHTDMVNCVDFSADGRRAVSASLDQTLRVWDIECGLCLKTTEKHTKEVSQIILNADGRRAVSISSDQTLRVWSSDTGHCLHALEGHTHYISSADLTTDGGRAVSASWDQTLRVWDMESGLCIHVLEGHTGWVNIVVLSADGRRVVSAGWDQTLRVWDMESGRCLNVLEGHRKPVASVVISADGRRAVSGGGEMLGVGDSSFKVWDLESGQCTHLLEGHKDDATTIVLIGDGRQAISGSRDGTLRMWDLESGLCLKSMSGHIGSVNAVIPSSDEGRVISASEDKTLRVWDLASGQCIHVLKGHTSSVFAVSLSEDGNRAISASKDNTLRIWHLKSGRCLHKLDAIGDTFECDGVRAISCAGDKALRIWDLGSGRCLQALSLRGAKVIKIIPHYSKIVIGFADGRMEFFHIDSLES
jgi:WD40 repeat protein